jgi:hypothetical protein
VTDPESPTAVDREDLVEREVDVADELDRERPTEADDADVYDQRRDVPEDDDDAYR